MVAIGAVVVVKVARRVKRGGGRGEGERLAGRKRRVRGPVLKKAAEEIGPSPAPRAPTQPTQLGVTKVTMGVPRIQIQTHAQPRDARRETRDARPRAIARKRAQMSALLWSEITRSILYVCITRR